MYEEINGGIYAELDESLLIVEAERMSMLVPNPDAAPIDIPRDEALRMLEAAGIELS